MREKYGYRVDSWYVTKEQNNLFFNLIDLYLIELKGKTLSFHGSSIVGENTWCDFWHVWFTILSECLLK